MYSYKNKAQQASTQPSQTAVQGASLVKNRSEKWLMVLALCVSSAWAQASPPSVALASHATSEVEQLTIRVLTEIPHDAAAFTQGLLFHDGHFYESTGLYGRSSLRKLDASSGKRVLKRKLNSKYFGEGLARVGQQLIQLTWLEGRAFVYDLADFSLQQEFQYQGEGWGLCFDDERLWMSDGSSLLQRRNPEDFSAQGQLKVTLYGEPLDQLNELACVGNHIYANIWHDERIVRINKSSGQVDAIIDASALIAASGRSADPEAVLNGIAYDEQAEVFYLTGKLWPKIFKVQWQEKKP